MYDNFHRLQVMECPSCGASLALPEADSFNCDYCGKLIILPPELRSKAIAGSTPAEEEASPPTHPQQQYSTPDTQARTLARNRFNLMFVAAMGVLVLIAGIVLFSIFQITSHETTTADRPAQITMVITPLPTMVQLARLEMVFGSEGDQPGQFDDARYVAVDPQGNIFVADYTTGRINKFDQDGNFLQLIRLKPDDDTADIYIMGMAADASGNLYVAAGGDIYKYDTSSGDLSGTIPDQWPEIYFDSIAVAPDGNLYATNGMAGADDVIILSPEGEIMAHWTDTVENVNHDDPSVELVLGINHTGKVFILSPMGNKVYAYNPDGTFSFSFGEPGEHAGQFDLSTGMLAVTEKDYLVVSDVYRVDLFDANGNYLNRSFTIDYNIAGGSMFGMTIDSNGDLYYISSGGKVLKFDMNYP